MHRILAKDIMTPHVITVQPDLSVRELVGVMTQHRIYGCPVVDDDGRLVGVVSVTDVLEEQNSHQPEVMPAEDYYTQMHVEDVDLSKGFQLIEDGATRVADIMTPKIVCVDEEVSIKGVAATMVSRRIHRVFVVQHGRLTGVITALDILKIVKDIKE